MAAAQDDALHVAAQELIQHRAEQHLAGEFAPPIRRHVLKRKAYALHQPERGALCDRLLSDLLLDTRRQVRRQQGHRQQQLDFEARRVLHDGLRRAVLQVHVGIAQETAPHQAYHETKHVVERQERQGPAVAVIDDLF